jgi:hypothetical protein
MLIFMVKQYIKKYNPLQVRTQLSSSVHSSNIIRPLPNLEESSPNMFMYVYNCFTYVCYTYSTLFTGSYTMNILQEACSQEI